MADPATALLPLHVPLPANVMVSSSIDGKPRYGVKVKLPWMRNQVRCGSSFTHPNEASTIAKLFLLAARESCQDCRIPPLAHSDDVIVLDEFEMREAEARGDTITMYRRRSTVGCVLLLCALQSRGRESGGGSDGDARHRGAATTPALAPSAHSVAHHFLSLPPLDPAAPPSSPTSVLARMCRSKRAAASSTSCGRAWRT